MNELSAQCRSISAIARGSCPNATFPDNTPRFFDEMAAFSSHNVQARLGLPPDGPPLPLLTLPDEYYDKCMKEIMAMDERKRKNWKGFMGIKGGQRKKLVWSVKFQRIHSADGFPTS